VGGIEPRPAAPSDTADIPGRAVDPRAIQPHADAHPDPVQAAPVPRPAPAPRPTPAPGTEPARHTVHTPDEVATTPAPAMAPVPHVPSEDPRPGDMNGTVVHQSVGGGESRPIDHGERQNGCTAPQLRRFIKSRPYVPMHELRRRFAIDGDDDDVTAVAIDGTSIFVGLPGREGALLGELLRGGEIGYELSLDPMSPIVVGVYPMRPVPRT
jgi:hypothetical protein